MATVTWNAGSDDWSIGADWSDGTPPNDLVTDATIDVASGDTVTIGSGESFSAHSLTVDSMGAQFRVGGTLTLAGSLNMTAGQVAVLGGTLQAGTINIPAASGALLLGTGVIMGGVLNAPDAFSVGNPYYGQITLDGVGAEQHHL